MSATAYDLSAASTTANKTSRREWTIRRIADGGWQVYRGERHVGLLYLWRSGHVEWHFALGDVPSQPTKRRLLAEVRK